MSSAAQIFNCGLQKYCHDGHEDGNIYNEIQALLKNNQASDEDREKIRRLFYIDHIFHNMMARMQKISVVELSDLTNECDELKSEIASMLTKHSQKS